MQYTLFQLANTFFAFIKVEYLLVLVRLMVPKKMETKHMIIHTDRESYFLSYKSRKLFTNHLFCKRKEKRHLIDFDRKLSSQVIITFYLSMTVVYITIVSKKRLIAEIKIVHYCQSKFTTI